MKLTITYMTYLYSIIAGISDNYMSFCGYCYAMWWIKLKVACSQVAEHAHKSSSLIKDLKSNNYRCSYREIILFYIKMCIISCFQACGVAVANDKIVHVETEVNVICRSRRLRRITLTENGWNENSSWWAEWKQCKIKFTND